MGNVARKRLDLDQEKIVEFCRKHRIRKLSLFGSALRDDFGPESDVDLLVEFEPDAKVGWRFFSMERELSQIVGRRVDLNTIGFLSPYFVDKVVAEAEVLFVAA